MRGEDVIFPFSLKNHEKEYLASLQQIYFQQKKSHLFTPISDRSTIITLTYLIKKLQLKQEQTDFLYAVQSTKRKKFLLQLADHLLKPEKKEELQWFTPRSEIRITSDINELYKHPKLLLITTVQQYANHQFYQDSTNVLSFAIFQTKHITSTMSSMIEDYITDTYIRRAYIEACKLQERYKMNQKPAKPKKQQKKPQIIRLISLISKDSSNQDDSPRNQNRGIYRTYQQKRNQIKSQAKGSSISEGPKFEKNELILISLMIYILGHLQNVILPRKAKSLKEFFEQFENKTLLPGNILEEMPKYLKRVIKNCQGAHHYKIEQMYLYQIWQFLKKIQILRNLYHHLHQKGILIKFEKMTYEKNDFIIEESVNCMRISLIEPKKILKILGIRIRNFTFVQSLMIPESYITDYFGDKILVKKASYSMNNLFGIQISKTPSNQDIEFTKNLKNVSLNIKMKACGVLLYELSQFVPDGMIVYFYSSEGLSSFLNVMNQEEQKILSKIDSTKKIFYESQFEQENIKNVANFQKCCNIGKGSIYFLSANSNLAKYQQFYRHYSKCIVFVGLPKDNNQKQQDITKRPEGSIPIVLKCLNSCVNDLQIKKSIIFVGREMNDGFDKWLQFVKAWDETTRSSLGSIRDFHKESHNTVKKDTTLICNKMR